MIRFYHKANNILVEIKLLDPVLSSQIVYLFNINRKKMDNQTIYDYLRQNLILFKKKKFFISNLKYH